MGDEQTTDLIFDVETTTFQKGNPFARRNRLCYVGTYLQGSVVRVSTPDFIHDAQRDIVHSSKLVGFNIKFDLHHLRRAGVNFDDRKIWDVQLAHFLLTNQRERFPSLQSVCDYYGVPGKLGFINENYWSKGIDTPDIPPEEMIAYLEQDIIATKSVYEKQKEHFRDRPQAYKLFQIQCMDLLVLAEMEWNGLKLDVELAKKKSEETHKRLSELNEELGRLSPHVALNFDSGDDISALLYGGTITRERREVAGLFKTGAKIGEQRFRIIRDVFELPRLAEPIEGTELKKPGYWATDEKTLLRLKGVKKITNLLLEHAGLSKLLDYYDGYLKITVEMDWEPEELHSQLQQCVVVTGRLSSAKPNQQNMPDAAKELIVSQYND